MRRIQPFSASLPATLTLWLAMLSPFAANAETMEEIIVQGEFRDVRLTDVGISVSVLTTDAQKDTLNHLEEVLGRISNVNFSSGASRARFIQIRGIGERGQFAEPLNSSVGLLVDGVDLSGIGTVATMHDVAQVEVFRGPQGTLYGANALAGLVNVVSRQPDMDDWGGEVSLDLGDYDSRSVGAVLTGPLSDRLGLRVGAYQHRDDGFIDNTFLGSDDTNERDERTVRAKLAYAGDNTSWQLTVANIDVDNGYDAFSLDNNRRTRSDEPGRDTQDSAYVAFGMETYLNDRLVLEANLGYVDSEVEYGYDEDWTFTGFDPIGYTSTDFYGRDRDTTTADVRLLGAFGEDVSWVAGVFALQQDVSLQRVYTFQAQDFFSDFEIDRLAFYGEVTWPLSDISRIKVGLRAERHESSYDDSLGVTFSPEDDMFGGRVVYERDVFEDALFYVGLNRGYKAGGFNTSGTLDADLREFDPENLLSVEAGLKGLFMEGRMRFAGTIFHMERSDVQVNTSIVRVRGDGSSEFIDYIGNAAEGFNRGAELEIDFIATDTLTLFGSVGWLDTEYDDFVNGAGAVLDGREQAQAPDYQFFVGAEWAFAPSWFARVEVEGRDGYFFSDTHDTESDSYELLHASIGYEGNRFQATLWGRNLTDEDYFVRGFFFGNDPRDFYTARSFTQLGEPSRFGVSARYSF